MNDEVAEQEGTPVRLKFSRERKVRRTGKYPFYVEITFPPEMKPKLLPDRGDIQLYASAYIHEADDLVRFEFRLTPRDELEMIAGVDTLVGLREVWIQIRGVGETMPNAWKERKTKLVTGTLEDKDDTFTITFSRDQ